MDILQKMLMNEKVDKDVSLSDLAKRTEDFTGSGNNNTHPLNILLISSQHFVSYMRFL